MLTKLKQWWERRETSGLRDPQKWLRDAIGAEETDSGIDVTSESSLRATAVFAAVRVLSESLAVLPCHLYRREGESRNRESDSTAYRLLHDSPNEYQSAYEFLQLVMVWLCLHGNAYAEIERDKSGAAVALWPIRPDWVRVVSNNGALGYEVYFGGEKKVYRADQILHFKGLSTDGINGLSPIAAARQSIGVSLAAEKFGATYFGQGFNLGGTLEMPTDAGPEKAAQLRETWTKAHAGTDNFHRIAVLYGGAKFTPFKISNSDAQFLETRKFGVEDVARVFRVPPFLLGDLSQANYSNITALDASFAKYSLLPWTTAIEGVLNMKLLGPRQRGKMFYEFDYAGLLRGDHEAEMRALQAGIYSGIYSPNEARRIRNLAPREGGDVFLQPTNVAPSPWNPNGKEKI